MKAQYELALPQTERQNPDPQFTHLWAGLNESTTAHGIPRFRQYRGPLKKIFWAVIILGCFVMVTYNTTTVFIDFFRFDVNVDVKIVPNVELPFPAVTICNLTPINRVALENSTGLESLKDVLGATSSRKRRRKRAVHSCPPSNIDPSSNYCFMADPDNIERLYVTAVFRCAGMGMKIAVVDTPEKQAFIENNDLINGVLGGEVWIGREEPGGIPTWRDGTPVNYTNYMPGPVTEKYAVIRESDYLWENVTTGYEAVPFCQVYIETSTAQTTEATGAQGETTVTQTTPVTATRGDTTVIQNTPETTTRGDTTITQTTPVTTTRGDTTITQTSPVTSTRGDTTVIQTSLGDTTAQETTTFLKQTTQASETTQRDDTAQGTTEGATNTDIDTTLSTSAVLSSKATTKTVQATTSTLPDTITIDPEVPLREEFIQQEDVIEAVSDLPFEKKSSIGFTAAGMILDCQYAGRQCFISDFDMFYNPIHGNCFVFNSGWNSSRPLFFSKQTGVRYGLHLTLDIHQDQYVTSIGRSAGARVLINDQYQMPFPEEEGHHAPPGFVTAFGLRKSCMKTCYQHHVISKCDCADPYVEKYGAAFNYRNMSSCDVRNATQFACREAFIKLYTDGELKCNCPNACRDTMFVPVISSAIWPSEVSKLDVVSDEAPQYINDTTKIHENLLKLEIFYNDFNFEEITEKPAYTWEKLISDVGGSFGLWIGWSIITIFEFFEFFTDLIVLALMKFSKDNLKKKNAARLMNVKSVPEAKTSALNPSFISSRKQEQDTGKELPKSEEVKTETPSFYGVANKAGTVTVCNREEKDRAPPVLNEEATDKTPTGFNRGIKADTPRFTDGEIIAKTPHVSRLKKTASSQSVYSGFNSLNSLASGAITPTDVKFDESRCTSRQTLSSNTTGYSTLSSDSSDSQSSLYTGTRSGSKNNKSNSGSVNSGPSSGTTITTFSKKETHPLLFV